MVGMLCLVALFAIFGEPERGWAAAVLLAPFPVVVHLQWEKRREAWFWLTIVILGAATAPAIVLVPWRALQVASPMFYLGAMAEYGVVYACVALVDKALHRGR